MISFKAQKFEIDHASLQFKNPQIKQTNQLKKSFEIKALQTQVKPTISFKNPQINQPNQPNQLKKSFEIKALQTQVQPTISFKNPQTNQTNQLKKSFEIKVLQVQTQPTISFKNKLKKGDICDNKIHIEVTYNQKENEHENKTHDLSKIEFFIKDEIIPKIIGPYHKHKYDKVKHYINGITFRKHLECFEKTKYKSDAILYLIKEVSLLILDSIEDKEEITELNDLVIDLNKKIKNLEKQIDKKKTYDLNIKTDLDVKITLKDKYFIYIAKFGLPKHGKFDPKKLEEC